MDRRERITARGIAEAEALRAALVGWQASLWTALPGIVESIDDLASQGTVDIRPTIRIGITQTDGTVVPTEMPILLDCPVFILGGGGFHATFPIQEGDDALVVFANRCIDQWWVDGGVQDQAEIRMHDLSDGFAFIGPIPLPKTIPAYSTASAQLRTDDGQTFIDMQRGTITINAATINLNATQLIQMKSPVIKEN